MDVAFVIVTTVNRRMMVATRKEHVANALVQINPQIRDFDSVLERGGGGPCLDLALWFLLGLAVFQG